MYQSKDFKYLTSYCSFLDKEITVTAEYALIAMTEQTHKGVKFMSHNCPHHDECQRGILECELATLGRSRTR